jgi:hypothetical protein
MSFRFLFFLMGINLDTQNAVYTHTFLSNVYYILTHILSIYLKPHKKYTKTWAQFASDKAMFIDISYRFWILLASML